jgi:mannitol operon repressor
MHKHEDPDGLMESYFNALKDETPRGAVIISSVVLENLLGNVLKSYLSEHKDVQKLLASGVTAPLGSFYARTLMAFGLRLILEDEYQDLNRIRDIRNHFAHNLHASFSDAKVKDLCKLLNKTPASNKPLDQFIASASLMAIMLTLRIDMVATKRTKDASWQKHLAKERTEQLKDLVADFIRKSKEVSKEAERLVGRKASGSGG